MGRPARQVHRRLFTLAVKSLRGGRDELPAAGRVPDDAVVLSVDHVDLLAVHEEEFQRAKAKLVS